MACPITLPRHDDDNGWWGVLPVAGPATQLNGEQGDQTAVIGAGICGLSTARHLGELKPEDAIAVIDAEGVGYGVSGRNAGFVLTMHSHGPPKQLDVLNSNVGLWTAGLERLRKIVRDHQIQCDWNESGRIYGAGGPDGLQHLEELA